MKKKKPTLRLRQDEVDCLIEATKHGRCVECDHLSCFHGGSDVTDWCLVCRVDDPSFAKDHALKVAP